MSVDTAMSTSPAPASNRSQGGTVNSTYGAGTVAYTLALGRFLSPLGLGDHDLQVERHRPAPPPTATTAAAYSGGHGNGGGHGGGHRR